jgi:transposase-like protein
MKAEINQLAAEISTLQKTTSNRRFLYPDSVRNTAVRLFKSHSDGSAKRYAREIGISDSALYSWINQATANTSLFVPISSIEAMPNNIQDMSKSKIPETVMGLVVIYIPSISPDALISVVRNLGKVS